MLPSPANVRGGQRFEGNQLVEYIFLAFVIGLVGSVVLGVVCMRRKEPLPGSLRGVLTLLLLAPVPFCVFGFAASFEPGPYHWAWKIGYAIVGLGCLAGALRLFMPRRKG